MSRLVRLASAVLAPVILLACSGDDGDDEMSAEDRQRVDEFWAGTGEEGHGLMCQRMETPDGRLEVVEYFTGPEMGSSPLSEEQAEQVIDYLRTEKC